MLKMNDESILYVICVSWDGMKMFYGLRKTVAGAHNS